MQQDVEVMKLARGGPEMVPRCSPGAGASHLSREGPAPPRSRAAGARGQLCRLTAGGKSRRGSGTGGTPGRTRTDHIVQNRGGEPPRAHRRAGSRGTRPRRQRGESSSRRPADMAVATAGFFSLLVIEKKIRPMALSHKNTDLVIDKKNRKYVLAALRWSMRG